MFPCDKWVPVTTAWRVLRLRVEERPPMWRVAANILNKQSRTADKGWSSSLEIGRGADNSSSYKLTLLRNRYTCFGPGLLLWYDVRNGKGTYLREVGREGVMEWNELAQDRDRWRAPVNAVMNLRIL